MLHRIKLARFKVEMMSDLHYRLECEAEAKMAKNASQKAPVCHAFGADPLDRSTLFHRPESMLPTVGGLNKLKA